LNSSCSTIRNRFPKISKLDGEVLPPPIGFDIGQDKLEIPSTLGSNMAGDLHNFVFGFLEQYYNLFDTNRQELVAAYHEHACFSFSISKADQGHKNAAFAPKVLNESRNLLRIPLTSRAKLIKQGKMNVVAFLSELPQTAHQPDSFLVDVPFHSEALAIIVVNGVYHEVQSKQKLVRFFCRTFSLVPQGAGFVIINDQLLAGNATFEQVQKYKATGGGDDTSMVSAATTNPGIRSALGENQLIENLARETRMTAAFARKCLEENNYDFNKALECFYELNKRGIIPDEAWAR
jgi:nuclear RNA export factor